MNRIFRFHAQQRTRARSRALVRPRLDVRDQAGIGIIEVLIGAMLLVTVTATMLGAIEAAGRSTAEERHRSRANSIAQQDQARMRSMSIADVANLQETRTVTQDGTPYSVVSRGDFVTDATGTASCAAGTASADYIKITSTVSWPSMGARPPVVSESIVSPPSGSIDADHGALAIQVNDSQSNGIAGVGLSGTGAGSFSGSTGPTGCVIFGDLPVGNYSLTPSLSGKVDKDGNPPAPQTVSVVGQSTNTVVLMYDNPGSVQISFTTKVGSLVPSSAESIMAFNTGMTQAKAFGTPGTKAATVTATPLFPFTSPDTFYAGTCTGDNPSPGGPAAMASVTVPVGGSASATIQLPALHLTVRNGTGPGSPGALVPNSRVRVYDLSCASYASTAGTTNAAGQLPDADRGLPYSVYHVCADVGTRYAYALNVNVKDLTNGTTLVLYGTGSQSVPGSCP